MLREFGTPTLFLTFSCAEYESPDIVGYLRIVNDVSPTYVLCTYTEDPIFVSRKFSLKFHAFFQTIIVKGQVSHYFWKKEYQARCAPHYHVLLWIKDAPVVGKDESKKILDWIQERITCRIPDEHTNPVLLSLVCKYQMHRCSGYCKRRKRFNKTFITRCKFGFPRPECDCVSLKAVDDCLKSNAKIYQLARGSNEVRVNDYNPLLLLLWKANMDIQYIAESSLTLAHYVSGYVTKAEKSHMQDLWQEVGSNNNIYSKLFSFGVCSLRSRECGLYEASDLVLGYHLYEKSETIKWVDISLPHKRKRRLKDKSKLTELLVVDPNSTDIWEPNVVSDFYPNRSQNMSNICLYDFIAHYKSTGVNVNGKRVYSKLGKTY